MKCFRIRMYFDLIQKYFIIVYLKWKLEVLIQDRISSWRFAKKIHHSLPTNWKPRIEIQIIKKKQRTYKIIVDVESALDTLLFICR